MTDTAAYQLPEGFTIPVRRSLTEPILLGGVPRTAAILNGTLAAALGLGLQLWLLGIIYYVCAHTLCVFFASRDPQFMEVLVRHIKHKGYLS
ncbi:VirB3 family type IV secretion system protein [Fretibacter rubidus]|jgi:type IV secretion system protein VirB3|uniref:VirB3 family type IV secretion system protein n=1 Tax=Fretibacter rubidus TaxID=570162 RepID=UPI00352B2E4A